MSGGGDDKRFGKVVPIGAAVRPRLQDVLEQVGSQVNWEAKNAAVAREREEANAAGRREARLREIRTWVARGVPLRHLRRFLARAPNETPALTALADVTMSSPGIRVLSGNVGCGKTYAAARWLVNAPRPHAVMYVAVTERRFVSASEFERASRYQHGLQDDYERAELLVLDDLGVEFADKGGNALTDLDTLMNKRYERELPTVITTNLEVKGFKARYKGRLASRVRDEGAFVNVQGPDLRAGSIA